MNSLYRGSLHKLAIFLLFGAITCFSQSRVTITIVEKVNNELIPNVSVVIAGLSPGTLNDTLTASSGQLSFDAANGIYKFVFNHIDYHAASFTTTINADTNLVIEMISVFSYHLHPIIADTLYKEFSPHYFLCGITLWKDLFIEHGCRIIISKLPSENDSHFFIGRFGKIIAKGLESDPIYFISNEPSAYIHLLEFSSADFSYCNFDSLTAINISGADTLKISRCSFSNISEGVKTINYGYIRELIIKHSIFKTYYGITRSNAIEISNTVFHKGIFHHPSYADHKGFFQDGIISHNNFYDSISLNKFTPENEIEFRDNIISYINFGEEREENWRLSYNIVEEYQGSAPTGFGDIQTTNTNDDSTDFFLNIFSSPDILNYETGELKYGSAAIGAASDSTNIGVYQGEVASVYKRGETFIPHMIISKNQDTYEITIKSLSHQEGDLTIYDIAGTPIHSYEKLRTVTWDMTTENGQLVPNGIYFFVMRAGNKMETRKISLVRKH